VVIGGDGQHGPAEYADLATIPPYYRALREFLEDLDFPENLDPGASG
jgi:succinyl-diaminopimelate desuccinylase